MPTIFKTNAGHLADRFTKRARAIRRELEIAERQNIAEAKRAARGFSNARAYRPKRDKTRPYALRRPHPPLPPFIVNKQSGRFERSWKTRVSRGSGRITSTLYNTAPYSGSFDGKPTKVMIARPILQQVNQVIRGDRRKRMRRAVQKALTGHSHR